VDIMSEPAKIELAEQQGARALKGRVEYFLNSTVLNRQQVADFTHDLTSLGQTAIVGGMLRDLQLAGNRCFFRSDVDFVVQGCSKREFSSFMERMGGRANRFGGYQIALRNWKVEAWLLENTWAQQQGICEVREIGDVRRTTFFDWDAILYDVLNKQLLTDGSYFSRVAARVLDIRLRDNPNPTGNAVRALRYAARWNTSFGPSLAEHVLKEIIDNGWEKLASIERQSFRQEYISLLDQIDIEHRLREHVGQQENADVFTVVLPEQQQFSLTAHDHQLSFDQVW
jgi:hypothetical protein